MNRPMKKLKSYLPTMDTTWKYLETIQRAFEGIASVIIIAMSAFWLTNTIQSETFDLEKDSILELIEKGASFIFFAFLVGSNIITSQFGNEEWTVYWYNCFGKISFEVVLVSLIYWLTGNVYYTILYGIYALYAIVYFCTYGHRIRTDYLKEKRKEELKVEKEEKDSKDDVYRKIKARFPNASSNSNPSRHRKRGKRM
uniref:Conserved domain protein n=1 Tax=Caenorhabditis tropicalis TaxID=1561998 RepID=A0A1I7TET3_9PELO